jgi:hypothetical protein
LARFEPTARVGSSAVRDGEGGKGHG